MEQKRELRNKPTQTQICQLICEKGVEQLNEGNRAFSTNDAGVSHHP